MDKNFLVVVIILVTREPIETTVAKTHKTPTEDTIPYAKRYLIISGCFPIQLIAGNSSFVNKQSIFYWIMNTIHRRDIIPL